MSMDQSAIKEIKESQTTAELAAIIGNAKLDMPLLATPDSFRIHSLEKYLPGRNRYRGLMETVALEDFTSYCLEFGGDESACFVDPQRMTARTVFNLGSVLEPGHADFTAKLSLIQTAELKDLLQLNGERCKQKRMAEFMEDYADNITCYSSDGEAIPNSKAVAAIRRLTIESSRKEEHETQDFNTSRSALEKIEARSDEGLPAGFRFECTPYNGLDARSFDLRLSILTGGDAPTLTARIKRLEATQEDMGRELQEKLAGAFKPSKINTYIGSFAA
ncbi:DUF2303 family protein [Microbulbifer sp. 2205BS26-8]|uniref:DUF2303 family protein n=1 Tax=Microbulbifer sp. 2205BS26-8 TaxID=3064386 RepID=UPI00273E873A|nr:DUF2303 family protein [Microbulbifer sp. 2205BS26-8]MDP5208874.1 DUF2303 family protein [Microbulbifer sp. 2205BS26-8]